MCRCGEERSYFRLVPAVRKVDGVANNNPRGGLNREGPAVTVHIGYVDAGRPRYRSWTSIPVVLSRHPVKATLTP